MEILEDDKDDNSNNIIDSKKETITKAIEDITELINKYENLKDIDTNKIIDEIILYINQNKLDCFDICDGSKSTLLHKYCSKQKYFHFQIYILTIEKILNDTNRLNEYLLKENISKENIFESSSELGDIKIFNILSKYLSNNNSLLTSLINKEKNNIFHISARENKILSLLFFYEYYKDNPSVLNIKNKSQWTPLIIACYQGNFEYVQTIINLGADFSLIENNGKNALFYAVESENNRIIKYLILIGIDKNIVDNNNKKAIDYTNDLIAKDLLKNKNIFQTLFKCEIDYKSLKGHKNHIYLLILLFILIIIQSLMISFFNFFGKRQQCKQDLNFILFLIELIIFLICIIFEALGIIFYFYFHCIFPKNKKAKNENIKLYELFLRNNKICAKCKTILKQNTQHCIACDLCIDNWDHHCFWLNSCINNKNKKYFNFFMIILFLLILFNIILSIFLIVDISLYPQIYYAFTNICEKNPKDFNYISALILILFVIYFLSGIFLFITSLLPFFIEFLCSKDTNKEININSSNAEQHKILIDSEESNI